MYFTKQGMPVFPFPISILVKCESEFGLPLRHADLGLPAQLQASKEVALKSDPTYLMNHRMSTRHTHWPTFGRLQKKNVAMSSQQAKPTLTIVTGSSKWVWPSGSH